MSDTIQTRCCIAGGGPAGMMLGFLLARMGVDAVVLEKHADFLRDFRGDTIHPSTLELMYELGCLEEFLRRPHQEVRELVAEVGKDSVTIADFRHLPTHCKFIALMPQWDFLNFLAEKARRYPKFHLRTKAEVTDLIEENGRIVGAKVKTADGTLEVRADLTVGADGRHSIVRERAGLHVLNLGAPMDVFWMRLSRIASDPAQIAGHFDAGRIFIMIDRRDYWQCAFVIPKGTAEVVRAKGIEAFRAEIVKLSPYLADRVHELRTWDDLSLLTVAVDRLQEWSRPGLLCVGDAAHAMSPIGGVGINLAIQDAVAAANSLGNKLLQGSLSPQDLAAVQRRRSFPAKITQRGQVIAQNRIIRRVLDSNAPVRLPWVLKLLQRWPSLRRIPARLVGLGVRPEHVRTPEVISH
jgi:2-polyprenyl-6-methoxyphenol hydroxylase-like FAD-dependent oxidoreductase